MDAVFVIVIGAGVYLMWSAYKGHAPLTTAKSLLTATPAAAPLAA